MLQLEALENIASVMAPKERHHRDGGGGGAPGGGAHAAHANSARLRLDLFRAISFARRLAKSVAEEVVEGVEGVVK